MGKNKDLILTSVKVHPDIYDEFKVASIKNKFLFQQLVNRSMDLYIKDDSFKNLLHNHNDLVMSGSL